MTERRFILISTPHHHTGGFSLVEMLVSVGLLALLMSLLLPALLTGRQTVQRNACASNLRQLVLANNTYALDHQDFYVLAAEDINTTNLRRWHGRRDATDQPFDPARGPLKNYLGPSARIHQCPSFRRYFDQPGRNAGFEAGCGGYGYNATYIGGRYDKYGIFSLSPPGYGCAHSAQTFQVKKPAQTVMFTDTAFLQSHQGSPTLIAYSFCEPPFWQMQPGPPSPYRPNPTIHFRHRRAVNVAWVDGHVSPQQPDFSAPYLTHMRTSAANALAMNLGWFGPDSNQLFDLD